MYESCSLNDDDDTIETMGSRLKQLREARHLTQKQVALRINTSRSTICTYEKDVRQPPSDMLIKLACFYHVSTDYLLGRMFDDADWADLGKLCPRDALIIKKLIAVMEENRERQ